MEIQAVHMRLERIAAFEGRTTSWPFSNGCSTLAWPTSVSRGALGFIRTSRHALAPQPQSCFSSILNPTLSLLPHCTIKAKMQFKTFVAAAAAAGMASAQTSTPSLAAALNSTMELSSLNTLLGQNPDSMARKI